MNMNSVQIMKMTKHASVLDNMNDLCFVTNYSFSLSTF